MFSLFKKKDRKGEDRKKHLEDFGLLIVLVKNAEEVQQIAVGAMINLLNSSLLEKYDSLESFQSASYSEQRSYIQNLYQLEDKFQAKGKKEEAMGTALFKMYLISLMARDEEAYSAMEKRLFYFSKLAEGLKPDPAEHGLD